MEIFHFRQEDRVSTGYAILHSIRLQRQGSAYYYHPNILYSDLHSRSNEPVLPAHTRDTHAPLLRSLDAQELSYECNSFGLRLALSVREHGLYLAAGL
jgi:hypothetical protein